MLVLSLAEFDPEQTPNERPGAYLADLPITASCTQLERIVA